jgi:hypothetical protein
VIEKTAARLVGMADVEDAEPCPAGTLQSEPTVVSRAPLQRALSERMETRPALADVGLEDRER